MNLYHLLAFVVGIALGIGVEKLRAWSRRNPPDEKDDIERGAW